MVNSFFNKIMVALYHIPWVRNRWANHFSAQESDTIPWTPLKKPLSICKIVLLTTGGIHLKSDTPFDMKDKYGDPTYRKIPSNAALKDITITHDYYNHDDADQDINLVFPIEMLWDAQQNGLVGESAEFFYSFMGHIDKHHIKTLKEQTAKAVAHQLKREKVDIAFLVPA